MPRLNRLRIARARPKGSGGVGSASLLANPVLAPFGPADVSVPNAVDVVLETNSYSHFIEYEIAPGQGYGISGLYQDADNQAYIPYQVFNSGTTAYSGRVKYNGVESGTLYPNNQATGIAAATGDRLGCQVNIDGTFFYYLTRKNTTTNAYETIYQSATFPKLVEPSTQVALKGRISNPNVIAKNVTYGVINNPLRIVSATLDENLRPTVVIDYTGSPYNYKIAILRPDNTTVVLPAGAVTVVANPIKGRATLFFNTAIPTSEYGTSPIVSVVQVDASGNAVNDVEGQPIKRGAAVAMPVGPVAAPIGGINRASFSTTYYVQSNFTRDMALQTQLFTDATELTPSDGVSGMDMTGTIATIPGGTMYVKMPYFWPVGTYQLGNKGGAWPAGLSVARRYSTSGFNVDTVNKTVTIAQENVTSAELIISGTAPAGGFRLSAYLVDEASKDQEWHPRQKGAVAFLKAKVCRYMDMQKNNGDVAYRDTLADFWTGQVSKGVSFKLVRQESNEYATDPWIVVGWNWTPNAVKQVVTEMFTGLNSARRVYVECGPNETWNTAFFVCELAAMDGLAKGYRSDGIVADPIPLESIIRGTGNFGFNPGTPNRNFNQGDVVYNKNLGGVGQGLYKAKRAITAGNAADAIQNVTNDAWELLAANNACANAAQRAFSDKCKTNIIAINEQLDALGIARDRVVRVVAWQGQVTSAHQRVLAHNGLGYLHDAFATAPYFGSDMGNYTNTSIAGWGKTQKDLLNTDISAFKDAFFAAVNAVADAVIDGSAADKAAMDTFTLTNFGRRARWVCYEAGQHWVPQNWPGGSGTVNQVYFPQIYKDERFGLLYQRYINRWNVKCGDLMCMYDQGGIGLGPADTCWSIMENDLDFNQPVAKALNIVNA